MFKYESDSRKVTKGQTFIAIKGLTVDGHDYIDQAIKNGASHIICEKDLDVDIPYTKVKDTSIYIKELLSKEYKNQIDKLKLIGVTGTNGKTTSCFLIYQLLLELGAKASYIGTLGYYNGDEYIELNNTTPDILTVYKLLTNSQETGSKVVVMEVSSQALSYDRLYGVDFDIISFTNLTEDHLDYHKTMENYLKAKLLLLDHLKKDAVILANCDDPKHTRFNDKKHKFLTYGYKGDYKILDFKSSPSETNLDFSFENKNYNVIVPLTSKFNVYNYLTCLSIVNQLGYKIDDILIHTKDLKSPKGRCEAYKINNAYAVIDYAHTPDAMLKVINAYNELKEKRIITIFGCGGDRDPKKRPIMGDIATTYSDYVIITSDNPRTEDPNNIINDIVKGIKKDNYEIIEDRKEAIKKGVKLLKKDDILLVLGKGHENYQIIGKTKYHLDDTEEVLKYRK